MNYESRDITEVGSRFSQQVAFHEQPDPDPVETYEIYNPATGHVVKTLEGNYFQVQSLVLDYNKEAEVDLEFREVPIGSWKG